MIEIIIKSTCCIVVIASYVIMYVLPFIYILRKGKFYKGFLASWVFQFIYSFLISTFVPYLLLLKFPDQKNLIYDIFPEGNLIVAAIMIGWLPAFIVCEIAHLIYRFRNRTIKQEVNE